MLASKRSLKSSSILLVDDELMNLHFLQDILRSEGYTTVVSIQDPRLVLKSFAAMKADLILLDLNMPDLDGFEVMSQLTAHLDAMVPPIIVLTADKGHESLMRAFAAGARDYLLKPFNTEELLARVQNMLYVRLAQRVLFEQKEALDHLVGLRTAELFTTRMQVIQKLGTASEYRDNETGRHIARVSQTAGLIARRLGLPEVDCENLVQATPMHDVGKIGIPDAILFKPAKLTPEEWECMRTHTTIGSRILGTESPLLALATEIALTHHEWWNGSGYPNGLAGNQIPLSGRIVALADVLDALLSERPYKRAWTPEAALEEIRSKSSQQFDPALVPILEELFPQILAIQHANQDTLLPVLVEAMA